MILEKHQYRRFTRLYETLINFCAVETGLIESLEDSIGNEDGQAFFETEQKIWGPDGDRTIIDRYIETNPFNFNMADLAEIRSWSCAINDTFTVSQLDCETLFIYGWRAFSVKGLDREIDDVLARTPAIVQATLLPFDDSIVFAVTLSNIVYVPDETRIARIKREVSDYLKLDKVHSTAHELIVLSGVAREEQLSRTAHELIETTEAEMERKFIGMHEGVLSKMTFEQREEAAADHHMSKGPQIERTDVLSSLSIQGEPTDAIEEILARSNQMDLAQLASYMGMGEDTFMQSTEELVELILGKDLFSPDNLSWLMNLPIMTGSDATDRIAELYRHDGPLTYAPSEITTSNWPLPMLPLSALFEVTDSDDATSHYVLVAPREAREAMSNYDWDLACEKARAQEQLVSTLNLACEMYGIVSFDDFSERLGFNEFADTFGNEFANALLSRIVTLAMNNIVSFGVFDVPDGSIIFAHNCMRPFFDYADAGHAISGLSDNPIIGGMLESRKGFPPRPLGDWGDATDAYEYLYAQEPTRRLVQFLDAHVPDSQDDYEFADTVVQDEIDVNRLVRIETDNAMEDLQEAYDFNADDEVLAQLTEIYDAFTYEIPSWYYHGWSEKDIQNGVFES